MRLLDRYKDMRFILFIFFMLLHCKAFANAFACAGDTRKLQDSIVSIQKKTFIDNLPESCANLLKYDTQDASNNSSSWVKSMAPNEKLRASVFQNMANASLWGLIGQHDVADFLDGKKVIDPPPSPGGKVLMQSLLSGKSNREDYGEMSTLAKIATSRIVTTPVCAEINLSKAVSCGKGLSKIVQWLKVDYISLPEVFDQVLQSKKFEKGITIAAKKIIAKANGRDAGTSHLFEDLYQSFRDSGSSDKDSRKMAWDTLGIISTAGANLGQRLNLLRDKSYSDKTALSLLAISNASPLLDLISRKKNGETYSYPAGMKFNCDNGKPYHFLMSAYFAQRLVNDEGLDPESAATASFLAGKGYQMMASHEGRSNHTVLVYPPLHEENNLRRIDLSHEAAGAWFGANGSKKDIDAGMAALVQDANIKSPQVYQSPDLIVADQKNRSTDRSIVSEIETEIKNVLTFNSVIAPNAVFDYFKAH